MVRTHVHSDPAGDTPGILLTVYQLNYGGSLRPARQCVSIWFGSPSSGYFLR